MNSNAESGWTPSSRGPHHHRNRMELILVYRSIRQPPHRRLPNPPWVPGGTHGLGRKVTIVVANGPHERDQIVSASTRLGPHEIGVKHVSNEPRNTRRNATSRPLVAKARKPQLRGDPATQIGGRTASLGAHNPKVAGSNPAPATKKALGSPTSLEGFLASGMSGAGHVKPVSNPRWVSRAGCRCDGGSVGEVCRCRRVLRHEPLTR